MGKETRKLVVDRPTAAQNNIERVAPSGKKQGKGSWAIPGWNVVSGESQRKLAELWWMKYHCNKNFYLRHPKVEWKTCQREKYSKLLKKDVPYPCD